MAALQDQLAGDLRAWRDRLCREETRLHLPPTAGRFVPTPGEPFHNHPEVFLQLGGSTRFDFPGGRLTLHAGEACLMPAGVPHGEIAVDAGSPFQTLVLVFAGTSLGCIYAKAGEKRIPVIQDMASFAPVNPAHVGTLSNLCEHFAEEPETMSRAQPIVGALLGLALHALDHPIRRSSKRLSPLILRCQDLLHQRFTNARCNVASLAQELGCTPNYLSARFRREAGRTLTRTLNRRRMEYARELLGAGRLSVQDVALASGFAHPAYFIAQFRRAFRQTPGEYRRRNLGKI